MREKNDFVRVGIHHLAARLVARNLQAGTMELGANSVHELLYRALKELQSSDEDILPPHLHDPLSYRGLHRGLSGDLSRFFSILQREGNLELLPNHYRFSAEIVENGAYARGDNLLGRLSREMERIPGLCAGIDAALDRAESEDAPNLGHFLFDDEIRAHAEAKAAYGGPEFQEINEQSTVTDGGEPYLLLPEKPHKVGIILVHGFLASPGELREFGEKLYHMGYAVVGARLAGHGTSPWDLHESQRDDWLVSARAYVEIMREFRQEFCMVGFSMGGAITLRMAAENPRGLVGTAAICAPLKFTSRSFALVPSIHRINQWVEWATDQDGFFQFQVNDSDHPDTNYRHIPMRGLYEMDRLVRDLDGRLPEIRCPVLIAQATEDPVVHPESGMRILGRIGSRAKRLNMIPSKRHGILREAIGGTQELVTAFIGKLSG